MSLSNDHSEKNRPEIQRLFFALWPDDNLRKQIKKHSKTILRHGGGKAVALENVHVTLAFLGNVGADQQACVEQVADKIQCDAFELFLDRAGHFPRPRVLWVGCSETPDSLRQLVTDLSAGIRRCGLELDSRPYQAHLTLMRKVKKAPADMGFLSISWQVDRFVLVRSQTRPEGVRYEVIREWCLSSSK